MIPRYVRPSVGTIGTLGLKKIKMSARPTTAYIMLGERCDSNCLFCTQRKENGENDRLSRVIWPKYRTEEVMDVLKEKKGLFSRICFQTLDYKGVVDDVLSLSEELRGIAPISVSMVPTGENEMRKLRDAGVEYMSVALDAANPKIFEKVKGAGVGNRFSWQGHWNALKTSVKVFGKGNTHLIVGLGESDEDLIKTMIELKNLGIYTALFAFTPVNWGRAPDMGRYRAIQLAHALIYRKNWRNFEFTDGKLTDFGVKKAFLEELTISAFLTSGCPGCNRPFYNERPGKEPYNYPHPINKEIAKRALEMSISHIHLRRP